MFNVFSIKTRNITKPNLANYIKLIALPLPIRIRNQLGIRIEPLENTRKCSQLDAPDFYQIFHRIKKIIRPSESDPQPT